MTTRLKQIIVLSLLSLTISSTAFATTVYPNQVITGIGTQNGWAYFRTATAAPAECAWGNYYVDAAHLTSADSTAVSRHMSLITAAWLSGRPVKRVDYTRDAALGGLCFVSLIEY